MIICAISKEKKYAQLYWLVVNFKLKYSKRTEITELIITAQHFFNYRNYCNNLWHTHKLIEIRQISIFIKIKYAMINNRLMNIWLRIIVLFLFFIFQNLI